MPYKVQKPPLSNVWIQLLLVSIFAILCILLPGMFFFWPAQEEVASQNARLTDLRMKAVDYYGQGQYKKAIPFFEMAAYGHRDELPDVQLTFLLQRLGYCYEQTGDIEKALLSYKNAAEVARDNRVGANTEPCLRNYARMLRSVNRIEEAKSIEKEADAAKLELMRLKKQYPGHHYFK